MRMVSAEDREKISGMYLSVVKYYVVRFEELLGLEDKGDVLVKRALEGLFKGVTDYDPAGEDTIDRFIRKKILGELIECVKELVDDFDGLLARTRKLKETFGELEAEHGRTPKLGEIAERMGVEESEAGRLLGAAVLLFSHDVGSGEGGSPYSPAQTREDLAKRIEALDPDSRLVIALHHFEEFSFEEISKVLGWRREDVVNSYSIGVLSLLLSP